MILFDVTRAAAAGHRSGLTRVSSRLRDELGAQAAPVSWPHWDRGGSGPADWLLTPELFSAAERPGIREWLDRRPLRCAAIFYDAIPLKHPAITWPRSVARHPDHLKLLARFDRVFAISAASRDELTTYWKWLGLERTPPVSVLELGADAAGLPRVPARPASGGPPRLLCLGILEPRKNQAFLLEVCAELWSEGREFGLDLVGRVNPHFGRPVLKKIREFERRFSGLRYHAAADDDAVGRLFSRARATALPTIAEGGALPLLESLWRGVPCLGSDLPAFREAASGGGGLLAPVNDAGAWKSALRSLLEDDALHARLAAEARGRPLPTWSAAAAAVRRELGAVILPVPA